MASIFVNAVSCKMGGGLNDLVHTLPLLERRLQGEGWDLREWVTLPGWTALEKSGESTAKIELVRISSPLHRALWEWVWFPKIVRKGKPTVVFQFSNFIFRRLQVPQICVLRSLIFFSSDYDELSKRGLYQKVRYSLGKHYSRRTLEEAAALFCTSEAQKQDIIGTFGPLAEQVRVAHLGVRLPPEYPGRLDIKRVSETLPEVAQSKLKLTANFCHKILLNIAHYYGHKNFKTLLEGLELLSYKRRDITLVITGGLLGYCGPQTDRTRQELALARRLSERGVLIDLGPVSNDIVWKLLGVADLFVFPSSLESFAHPLLEAMSAGVPVVASDTAIHREICGDAAVFHDVYDAHALARCVEWVLDNSALRQGMIGCGKKVAARFSWEAHVDKLAEAILELAWRTPRA